MPTKMFDCLITIGVFETELFGTEMKWHEI